MRSGKISYIGPFSVLSLAAVLFGTAFSGITLLVLKGERAATLWLPFGVVLCLVTATFTVMPGMYFTQSTAALASQAQQAARPNERLVFFINNHFSIDFYAPQLPLREPNAYLKTAMKIEDIATLVEAQPGKSLLVMTPKRWLKGIEDTLPTETIDTHHTWALVRVTTRNPLAQ